MKTLRGKCPRCCPEGGACFTFCYTEDGKPGKKCSNCHLEIVKRKYTRSDKPTPSQQKVIDLVLSTFGGEVKDQKMIGRKVWISVENNNRNWIFGQMVYGSISVNGSFKLHLSGIGTPSEIKDEIDIRVYLRNESVHQKKEEVQS